MPKCAIEVLDGASHAALQEQGVDLVGLLKRNAFLPRTADDPPALSRDAAFAPPSPAELERAFESLSFLRKVVSPVFFSTRADGVVVPGLDAVPLGDARSGEGRPVLLVGNHQTLAPDLGFLVQEFITERNVLIRGLAHPVVAGGGASRMAGVDGGGGGAGAEKNEEEGDRDRDRDRDRDGDVGGFPSFPEPPDLQVLFEGFLRGESAAAATPPPAANATGPFGEGGGGGGGPGGGLSAFTTFGAVPVSGKNFYNLLAAGEVVLLFPGGVREAFKRKNEDYKLFWPSKPEFIRMAVRHGATIVPFAAVGAEDGIDIVADSDDIARLPFGLGDGAIRRSKAVPAARAVDTRVTEDGDAEELFVQPICVPKAPQRYYFKFGRPIETAGLHAEGFSKDEEKVRAMYGDVRREVEDGIDWLLRKRTEDPFGDTLTRGVWEAASGGKQAPTFNP